MIMHEHTCKLLKLTGRPATSIADAVDQAIKRSNKTLEACAGFRSSKRAAMPDKESFSTSG